MRRRWWYAAFVALVVGCLAACSGSPSPTPSQTPTTGTLTGTTFVVGGPVGVTTSQPESGLGGQVVHVHGGSGSELTTTSGPAGKFSFTLSPGAYTLSCGDSQPFAINAGQTVSLNCHFYAF